MKTGRVKQQRALEKAKQVILDAERKRAKERVGADLQLFALGDTNILKESDFAENVGAHLFHLYQEGMRDDVVGHVDKIGCCLLESDIELRVKAITSLARLSALLLDSNDIEVILLLFDQFVNWLEYENQPINGFGLACNQLHKLSQRLLKDKKYWIETERFLQLLHRLNNGGVERASTIHGMTVKLQESLATKEILENVTNNYLHEKGEVKRSAENVLAHLGRRSTIFLLNRLMNSNDKVERLQLIKLIPCAGNAVVPTLTECLKRKPPWYVVRNVVFIISELNNSSLYSLIQNQLSHRDLRVQQQVLSCIVKISGNKVKERLIEALPLVHDELKIQIIMQMGVLGGEDVGEALLDLLKSRHLFAPHTSIELLVKLCVALKSSPAKNVLSSLKELIDERKAKAGPTDPVLIAAKDALLVLEPKFRHDTQALTGEAEREFNALDFSGAHVKSNNIRRIEQSVKELIAQGDLETAGQKLYANAVTAARDKDFNSAELLRDKLLEINPLALSEVIRLGEIIEEEKSSSITNHHIAIWSELYEKMSSEEFNALYYAMRLETYLSDEVIVKAGETDPSLYFVNSGSVRLSCRCDNRETFLKRLQPGEVIGVGPFFSVSVWTVSMTSQTEVQIHVLSRDKFKELQEYHPGLETKLLEFCKKYDTIHDLLKMSGSDRREFPRYSVAILINNTLLDPYGNAGKRPFRGELIDISKGGLCFSIHISSSENARLLLGRQIVSEINLGGGSILKCFGVIVGVKYHEIEMQEFSVHVKFFRSIEHVTIMQVVNLEI